MWAISWARRANPALLASRRRGSSRGQPCAATLGWANAVVETERNSYEVKKWPSVGKIIADAWKWPRQERDLCRELPYW